MGTGRGLLSLKVILGVQKWVLSKAHVRLPIGCQTIDLNCIVFEFFMYAFQATDRQTDRQTDGQHYRTKSCFCEWDLKKQTVLWCLYKCQLGRRPDVETAWSVVHDGAATVA